MDRLQIAIEKARAQRAETLQNRPEPAIGVPPPPGEAAGKPAAEAEPGAPAAAAPAAPAAAPVSAPTPTPAAVVRPRPGQPTPDEIWKAIKPFDTSVRQLRNNRLLTIHGGPASVPYDLLRTRVLHQARQHGWKRIGVVSPTAGVGKTSATANLAFAFGRQSDLRTVVLDLDLRRPHLAQMLGQTVTGSMEDVLRGKISFVDHALRLEDSVAIGFGGSPAKNPSELLQSDRTPVVLDQIERDLAADLMIIDLPPMMATDDNFGFLSRVDCVLVLVGAEQSTMEQIEVTLRQLNELTTVMGLVLNKCRHVGGAYGYDQKYYY